MLSHSLPERIRDKSMLEASSYTLSCSLVGSGRCLHVSGCSARREGFAKTRIREFQDDAVALLSLRKSYWPPWSCGKLNRIFVLAYRHLSFSKLLGAFNVGHSQTAENVNGGREILRTAVSRKKITQHNRRSSQPTMRHRTQYHTVMILTLCLALSLNAWPAVGKRDNVTVNAGPGSINCVDADDWWTARFEPQNCYHALAVMTSRHVAQDPEMPYEFLARRTTGRTSFTQLQTPQWTSSGIAVLDILSGNHC